MSTAAAAPAPWLRSARWDLSFIILSVALAFLPYSVYVIFGGGALQSAEIKGTPAYNARVLVNLLVAVFIGGPHMYATFTRTILDRDFRRKRTAFVASSLAVPAAVFFLGIHSYESYVWLISIFFAMASVHALHQIVWLSEAYNRKAGFSQSLAARAIDYGLVLSSLYPIAVWKMVEGSFKIGPLTLKYNEIVRGWWWLAYLAFAIFFVMVAASIVKAAAEYREGRFNLPKTLLLGITAALMFWTPLFPNLDTAFQGVNSWHSFQYLALTWYAVHLREKRTGMRVGFLHFLDFFRDDPIRASADGTSVAANFLRSLRSGIAGWLGRIDRGTGWSTFYMLCMAMLPISGLLILFAGSFWPHLHGDLPAADEAYTYMGILSILLVHYIHDALLFTDSKAIAE